MYEYSFYITYILLLTTGTITLVEALRTKSQTIRNILNLETCISIVAAYFYSMFISYVENGKTDKITTLRYVDWSVTTPMMLISLILTMIYNSGGGVIQLKQLFSVFGLHYGMLLSGYLGETGAIHSVAANLVGFLFFGGLFTYIYKTYMKKYSLASMVLFLSYVVIWGMYGVVYFFPQDEKMLGYNILDLTSKCLIGLFLWAYFANVIRL
jgi:bacteriorhodopsin